MFHQGDLVLRQKHLDRQGVECRRIVSVKNPWAVLPHFRSSSHPFIKVCQNLLVVDLGNGLTFRHPVHVNNPSDVKKKKKIIIALNLDLLCRAFFCLGELGLFQCMDWRLLSGSIWKTVIQHKLFCSLKSLGRFQCSEECQHKCSFEFPFFMSEESRHHFHVEIVM